MEIEKNIKKHQMKVDKKSTKIEMEISIKDLNAKNIFSTLNRNDNIDFLAIKASNAMKRYDFYAAYKICLKFISNNPPNSSHFRAIQKDNMFFDILPIYCVCLYELKKLGELYQCAHNLVENYPKRALSWFAVVLLHFSNLLTYVFKGCLLLPH
jgi:anaphase-promoting complex subunit 6